MAHELRQLQYHLEVRLPASINIQKVYRSHAVRERARVRNERSGGGLGLICLWPSVGTQAGFDFPLVVAAAAAAAAVVVVVAVVLVVVVVVVVVAAVVVVVGVVVVVVVLLLLPLLLTAGCRPLLGLCVVDLDLG